MKTLNTDQLKDFFVINEKKEVIYDSDDFFEALGCLKKQPPNYKMIRKSDRKCMAYTAPPRPEDKILEKHFGRS